MNLYEKYFLPYLIDLSCGIKPVRMQREKVVPKARGKVLEIGLGTGRNMPHYDPAKIDKIWGLDPALEFPRIARKRIEAAGLDVELLPLSAETIPREDASFDTVLVTYTLCSISDPLQALREMKRVLKPDGRLIYCEHGLAPDEKVRLWQRRLTPVWRKISGNCHMDRKTPDLLRQAGFQTTEAQEMYIPGPKVLCYNYWGIATPG